MSAAFATEVVRRLTTSGFVAYWAGGCVRDILMGAVPKDYDVATSATPEQVRNLFGPRRSLAVGESFGVVIVLGEKGSGDSVEVATFRREGEYRDGRHPESVEFCSAEEDAGRRDFTINGMFYDPLTSQVRDYVGGQADLQRRVIRAIGDPRARMTEDKLRMLRAVRFAAALDFSLDPATATAISEMASQVRIVSAERIAQELRRMLIHPQRARAMQWGEELGLLNVILPEVAEFTLSQGPNAWNTRLQLLHGLTANSFSQGMAALLRDIPIVKEESQRTANEQGALFSLCRRLRLSNEETTRICWIREHRDQLEQLPAGTLAKLKRLAGHPAFGELLELERIAAGVTGKSLKPYRWIETRLNEIPPEALNPEPLVTGHDLLALGIASGPQFKVWLNTIRDAQLNEEITTREEALEMARKLAK